MVVRSQAILAFSYLFVIFLLAYTTNQYFFKVFLSNLIRYLFHHYGPSSRILVVNKAAMVSKYKWVHGGVWSLIDGRLGYLKWFEKWFLLLILCITLLYC